MQKSKSANPASRLEKHYNIDWAKTNVHEMLGGMLDSTILQNKKVQDVKVLHLAGIDAQETKTVYLSRGIIPQNITTVERDPSIARKIASNGLGITVVEGEVLNYITDIVTARKKHQFDVVSLDFTSPTNIELVHNVQAIIKTAGNPQILLHVANLLRREHNGKYIYGRSAPFHAITKKMFDTNPLTLRHLDVVDKKIERIAELFKGFETDYKENRSELKRESYPFLILDSILGAHTSNLSYWRAIRFLYGEHDAKEIERTIVNTFKSLEGLTPEQIKRITRFEDIEFHPLAGSFIFKCVLESAVIDGISNMLDYYELNGLNLEGFLNLPRRAIESKLWHAVINAGAETPLFYPIKGKHYSYISESGSPMVGSIYFISRSKSVEHAAQNTAFEIGFPGTFSIRDPKALRKEFNRYVEKEEPMAEYLSNLLGSEIVVEFLGNASRPILTKKKFLEELNRGNSIESIQEHYRGWSKMPLTQWKAHHTMGTYEKKPESDIAVSEIQDYKIEKITKDQALDLMITGIPIDEIYETYPTSFSVGQLRAFKAHVTMGTYIRTDRNSGA